MGLLTNLLFTQTGLGNAYNDPTTIYQEVLGDKGVLGGVSGLDIDQILDAVAGEDNTLDELFGGDGLGLGHLLADDTLVGGILADIDPFG